MSRVAVVLVASLICVNCRPAVSGDAVEQCNQNANANSNCAQFREMQNRQAAGIAAPFTILGAAAAGAAGSGDSQGCCSRHGGIASCDFSIERIQCSDGEYSPTCRCSK